jgi:hypothetical protein
MSETYTKRDRAGVPKMTAIAMPERPPAAAGEHARAVGPVGRLGRFAADHVRAVALAWAIGAVARF